MNKTMAGREMIDKQVAEKVMGIIFRVDNTIDPLQCREEWRTFWAPPYDPNEWYCLAAYAIPSYSTDMNCAMEVVERMEELNWDIEIEKNRGHGYTVNFYNFTKRQRCFDDNKYYAYEVYITEESLPLAICKAALMAIGERAMEGDFWLADQIKEHQKSMEKWPLWMQQLAKLEDYTQENPMTELDFKNVQTRDGREVFIYTTNGKDIYFPVVGAIYKEARWRLHQWTIKGKSHINGEHSKYDLVPAPQANPGVG